MRITSSAPGKLVLLGEYAVLQGAPALVLAVDRRATVMLAPIAGPEWEIHSPTLGLQGRLRVDRGSPAWIGPEPPQLAWVRLLLQRFPDASSLPPCRVDLESDRFQLDGGHKLGLGSSAALTVALLGALHALAARAAPGTSSGGQCPPYATTPTPTNCANAEAVENRLPASGTAENRRPGTARHGLQDPAREEPDDGGQRPPYATTQSPPSRADGGAARPTLAECIGMHRAIQHGRGSGIDIAASLCGGLLRFQVHGDRVDVAPLRWPERLRWACVYSGRPASTGAMLAAVDAWRAREPVSFKRFGGELTTLAARGVASVAADDAHTLLATCTAYARTLARFGEASGVDIASRGHRALGTIAAESGCTYKSCGAGGGDIGVTLAVEDEPLRKFRHRAAVAGFPMVDLIADPQGLMVAVNA